MLDLVSNLVGTMKCVPYIQWHGGTAELISGLSISSGFNEIPKVSKRLKGFNEIHSQKMFLWDPNEQMQHMLQKDHEY